MSSEQLDSSVQSAPQMRNVALQERLQWTLTNPLQRERLATEKRIDTTDLLRGTLLPRYYQHHIPLATQLRLIHRAHMKGNEHVLLHPKQAERVLSYDLSPTRGLAGVIRSREELDVNIGLAGMQVLCASSENATALIDHLGQRAEELFPYGGNPEVTEQTIYNDVSAFQFAAALAHPFYELNGRSSEDFMYALYHRRQDLSHTVRYISENGKREGARVNRRCDVINMGAHMLLQPIVRDILSLDKDELPLNVTYRQLRPYAEAKGMEWASFEQEYLNRFDYLLYMTIQYIGTPVVREGKSGMARIVQMLASDLENASPTYTMRDGIELGANNFQDFQPQQT